MPKKNLHRFCAVYVNGINSRPRWLSWMRSPTGDQEVAGCADSRRAVVSFWRKNVHNTS